MPWDDTAVNTALAALKVIPGVGDFNGVPAPGLPPVAMPAPLALSSGPRLRIIQKS